MSAFSSSTTSEETFAMNISSPDLSERDRIFLQNFMNVSERVLFSHVQDGGDEDDDSNDTLNVVNLDVDTNSGGGGNDSFDILGITIFVVCGHFLLKLIFGFFPCFVTCVVHESHPVRSLKFLYLLFSNLVLYACLWYVLLVKTKQHPLETRSFPKRRKCRTRNRISLSQTTTT